MYLINHTQIVIFEIGFDFLTTEIFSPQLLLDEYLPITPGNEFYRYGVYGVVASGLKMWSFGIWTMQEVQRDMVLNLKSDDVIVRESIMNKIFSDDMPLLAGWGLVNYSKSDMTILFGLDESEVDIYWKYRERLLFRHSANDIYDQANNNASSSELGILEEVFATVTIKILDV